MKVSWGHFILSVMGLQSVDICGFGEKQSYGYSVAGQK